MKRIVIALTIAAACLAFTATAIAINKTRAEATMGGLASVFCHHYESTAHPAWDCIRVTGPVECFGTERNHRDVPEWDCLDYFDQRSHGSDRRCLAVAGIDPYNKIVYAAVNTCVLFN